jgi:hypothetical protein
MPPNPEIHLRAGTTYPDWLNAAPSVYAIPE